MLSSEAAEYPRLWLAILRFYFRYVRLFGRVHPDLPSGKLLADLDGAKLPVEVQLGADFASEFNEAYQALKNTISSSLREPSAEAILVSCFAVRAVQCVVVWAFGWQAGLLAGLLQFVAAPLSLTAAFIRLFTNLSDCLVHYALNALTVLACTPLLAYCPLTLKIDMRFVVAFFLIDLSLNLFVYFRTAERWDLGRLLKHMLYGTFNTKTYFVVVLGCLFGLEFNLAVVVVASLVTWGFSKTGLQQRLLNALGWPCFPITFYVEHRIGHMPRVYPHAHKMHHYLHDTTAFDAHIYGNGLNEEFFWILAETLPCLAFPGVFFPYFLNLLILYISWTNKGAHTRTADCVGAETTGCFDEDNFHADHHTWHRANFGSSTAPLIDFYFGTACPGLKGANGRLYSIHSCAEDSRQLLVRVSEAGDVSCRVPRTEQQPGGGATEGQDSQAPTQAAAAAAGDWRSRVISLKEVEAKRTTEIGGPWVALHGAVFDLSTFQRIHPGGAEVLQMYAGTDATKAYDEIGHSDKAKQMSRKRLIGVLEGHSPSEVEAEFF